MSILIQPTCPPVNDNLMELLIMIDSCKRASADAITAVIPYFGYARQDRKDEGRTPITAKLTANLITRAGADRVLAMDLHAAQIQGFFDVPVDHLYAAPVLNEHFLELGLTDDEIVVVSPDEGSIKRASGHAKRLGGKLAIVDKRRANAMETTQENIIGGPIEGRVALMFDDLISTAGSICGAARLVHDAGAERSTWPPPTDCCAGRRSRISRRLRSPASWSPTASRSSEQQLIPQIKVL